MGGHFQREHDKAGRDEFMVPGRDCLEVRPFLDGFDAQSLRGEALAALGAAIGNHPAATDGFHARAEAVTAFANDFAGLISTFHGANRYFSTFSKRNSFIMAELPHVNFSCTALKHSYHFAGI
jgi:hypothetical protein